MKRPIGLEAYSNVSVRRWLRPGSSISRPQRRRVWETLWLRRARAPSSAATELPAVQMIGVNKWYGEFHVLRDIDLTVDQGEKIVICGPSGSGKSTLIRCINRLEEHQKGQIVGRRRSSSPTTCVRSTRSAPKSAWCSRASTCFHT